MRVLSVASEVYPLVKTGGLADVTGALPPALATHGVEMRTLLPGYRSVMARLPKRPKVLHRYEGLLGVPAPLPADPGQHAKAVADALLSGERKAILLGNAAAQHPQASALLAIHTS